MKNFLVFTGIILFSLSACSLRYTDVVQADSVTPEFIFSQVQLSRYEDNKITVEFEAENLEQYKKSSESFAKELNFKSYDKYGDLSTSGHCGYLSANTDTEVYTLYDDIQVYNKSNDTNFFSNALKWDSQTEQLTSGRSDNVRVEKDNTVIYGTGFSASGISNSFRFSGTVSGEIITKDSEEENAEE